MSTNITIKRTVHAAENISTGKRVDMASELGQKIQWLADMMYGRDYVKTDNGSRCQMDGVWMGAEVIGDFWVYYTEEMIDEGQELMATINSALDAKRAEHGFTNDRQLAGLLGTTPNQISRWRNGRQIPLAAALLIPIVKQQAEAKQAN